MSIFKAEIELKQVTPYIHFQYNQEGATLRATEVKPKLDKFLHSKASIKNDWYIGDTKSLNYKMKFEAIGDAKVSKSIEYTKKNMSKEAKAEIHKFYFGNQGSNTDTYKETVFHKDGIKMTVFCTIPELMALIKGNIAEFFILNNFGTRQNKGFGGFLVKTIDGNKVTDAHQAVINSCGKPFLYYSQFRAGSEKMMSYAYTVYTVMKGGSNSTKYDTFAGIYRDKDAYIKGYIQRAYLDDIGCNETGSDKAKIKKDVIRVQSGKEDRYGPANTTAPKYEGGYLFVRALLGLADHYEFRDDIRGTRTCKIENAEGIERFASPITIKIFDNGFYFIFDEKKISKILGKVFTLSSDGAKNDPVKIQVPNKFDVEKFIDGFINYYNKNKGKISSGKLFNFDKDAGSDNFSLKKGGTEN